MNLSKEIIRPPNCPEDYSGSHKMEDIPIGTGYRRNNYGNLIVESFAVSSWISACKNCSYCESLIKPVGTKRKDGG